MIFRKSVENFKLNEDLTRKLNTSHDDKCKFFIISGSFLLRLRSVSENVVKKIKTHILC